MGALFKGGEMSIKVRGNSFQATVHYNGRRFRRQFTTKQNAIIWENETMGCLLRGGTPARSPFNRRDHYAHMNSVSTMKDIFSYTYNHYWRGSKSEETSYINGDIVTEFLGEDTLICDVDNDLINQLISELKEEGNSNATINRKLSALSKMLNVAIDIGAIKNKPKIRKLKEPVGRVRWFDLKEERRITDTLEEFGYQEYAYFVVFLCDTGFRVSEAMGVRWSDIDKKMITIDKTKNDEPRAVPLTRRVKDILKLLRGNNKKPFENVTKQGLRTAWGKMREHLNMQSDKNFVPHTCRHTYISRLAQLGTPFPIIKKLAGHKSERMTLKYTHLCPDNFIDAVSRLDNMVHSK
tara:strand:- start:22498 stop:23550 length:1053 start_codon:yes stop_codon:yes gene_type:complete